QELLTGFFERGTVAVSANAKQSNRFIRHVIPNGIDLTLFRPNTALKSRVPAILFVGALTGRKRGGWLLDEFGERIRPACPDAELCALLGAALSRERLSRAGLIRAAEYDIRRTAEDYEQLIKQLIGHERPKSTKKHG